jgi:energy-coupling factor transport system permease protein
VDEWIVAIGLALRCLPLLLDEMRTLSAARRLRHRDQGELNTRQWLMEIHDVISTAIIVALRRARDLGDAIVARGGIHAIGSTQDGARTWRDAVVLVAVIAISVTLMLVPS